MMIAPSASLAASNTAAANPSDAFFRTVNAAVDQPASAIPLLDPDNNVVGAFLGNVCPTVKTKATVYIDPDGTEYVLVTNTGCK